MREIKHSLEAPQQRFTRTAVEERTRCCSRRPRSAPDATINSSSMRFLRIAGNVHCGTSPTTTATAENRSKST